MIRVLTVRQPHAGAMFTSPPLKVWETRSWLTVFRGQLAIHAGQKFDECISEEMHDAWYAWDASLRTRGAIIGVVDVVDCVPTSKVSDESEWGDFSPGRFAFRVENPRLLRKPVACAGRLGIWRYDGALGGFL